MTRIVLPLLLLLFCGCDESVDAVLGTEQAFTIYGHFNPRADTQAVRIFAIDPTIQTVHPGPLDANVISVDLATGHVHTWRDSVIRFSEHNYGHVYWARFTPAYGEAHRLSLERSDGNGSRVTVVMPPESEPMLVNPLIAQDFVHLPVLWQDAPRLNHIRVRYHTNRGTFTFDYPDDQEAQSGGQLATILVYRDVREVFREIFRAYGATRDARLHAIEQIVLVSSEDWVPPGGIFDADLLIEPGTFSNVENGFGFVGAGYDASFYYEVPDSVAIAAGFFTN